MRVFKGIARSLALLLVSGAFLVIPAAGFAETELSVFAAASLTESMNRVADAYKKVAPDVKLIINFDSSGTLKTQITEGAECDLFISAGQKQMNQIDIEADPKLNEKKLDFVMKGTRFNIVSNKVVMVVPKGRNPKGIDDFKDVVTDKVSLVALGNSDVPVGQYSEEIYRNLGLWDKLKELNRVTYCNNVKEVVSQVAAGAVDCGVVYGTDAAAAADSVEVVAKAPEGSHKPIVYPAAVMKDAPHSEEAKAFAEFLQSEECGGIFESFGFASPGK